MPLINGVFSLLAPQAYPQIDEDIDPSAYTAVLEDIRNAINSKLNISGGTAGGNLNMGNYQISNVASLTSTLIEGTTRVRTPLLEIAPSGGVASQITSNDGLVLSNQNVQQAKLKASLHSYTTDLAEWLPATLGGYAVLQLRRKLSDGTIDPTDYVRLTANNLQMPATSKYFSFSFGLGSAFYAGAGLTASYNSGGWFFGTITQSTTFNKSGAWLPANSFHGIQTYSTDSGYSIVATASVNQSNGNAHHITFQRMSPASVSFTAGQIYSDGVGTYYVTTSDERLKDFHGEVLNPVERILALQPRRFSFKADPTQRIVDGFGAQTLELTEPTVVSQPNDMVQHYGVDLAKLVPLTIAALQKALEKIAELEARLDAIDA